MGNQASQMLDFVSKVASTVQSVAQAAKAVFGRPPRNPAPFVPPKGEKDKATLIKEAREKLGIDAVNDYNFAIAGPSGVGKSTFINVLRGLKASCDSGWAAVGHKECTSAIEKYRIPNTHVVLWDMPGGDTDKRPAPTYFKDHSLYAFDAILLLYHNRVYTSCTNVVEGCHDWNVPLAFVRNKADADIDMDGSKEEVAAAARRLRRAMEEQVAEKAGSKARFSRKFLISCRAALKGKEEQFDFKDLLEFVIKSGKARNA